MDGSYTIDSESHSLRLQCEFSSNVVDLYRSVHRQNSSSLEHSSADSGEQDNLIPTILSAEFSGQKQVIGHICVFLKDFPVPSGRGRGSNIIPSTIEFRSGEIFLMETMFADRFQDELDLNSLR